MAAIPEIVKTSFKNAIRDYSSYTIVIDILEIIIISVYNESPMRHRNIVTSTQ